VELDNEAVVSLSIPKAFSSAMLPLLLYFFADLFLLISCFNLITVSGDFFSPPNLMDECSSLAFYLILN
jgi:hypothetical protein